MGNTPVPHRIANLLMQKFSDTPPSDSSSSSSRSAEMPEYLSKLPKRLPRRPAVPRKKPASAVSRLALKVYPKEMVPVGGPAPPRSGHA